MAKTLDPDVVRITKRAGLLTAVVALHLLGSESWAQTASFETLDNKLPAISLLEQFGGQRAVLPQGIKLRPVNARGLTLLENSEGYVDHLYNDAAHYCTIGYGHLIKKALCDGTEEDKYKGQITKEAAEAWLVQDLAQAEIIVMTSVTDQVNLTDDEYSSLCDIVYNIGGANFRKSTLLQAVNAKQFDRVPAQFKRWVNAGGRPLPGLVKRRNAEVALFFFGTAIPKGVPIPGEDLSPLDVYAEVVPVASGSASPRPDQQATEGAKFGFLVGINDYAQPSDSAYRIIPLKGPGNDVAMMKKLLVDRFGFQDDSIHIKTLTGSEATREAIITGLKTQLIDNAKKNPGATVVFYYSGHGSETLVGTDDTKGSGHHQTLVAYDSRADGGQDILDDEINAQLEQLSQYTDRITLIFDSCHSGSVWKDVTTMTSKSLPPNPFPRATKPAVATKDVGSALVPNGGNYSVIVAATAEESAVEDLIPTTKGEYHGLLTYYLDQAVRQSKDLTYDEAARRAATFVTARAPSQHPQAEGDINRILLGGASEHQEPCIRIKDVGDGKKFTIAAGLSGGLQNGTILAVYDKESRELAGDTDKIANAQVIDAGEFEAAAELMGTPVSPLSADAKVKIVTPFAPRGGLPVFVPSIQASDQYPNAEAIVFLDQVKKRLSGNKLLSITDDPRAARLLIRWTCRDKTESGVRDLETNLVQPSEARCGKGYSFYLSLSDQPYRLYDLTVDSEFDKLADAVGKYAAQENLRNLKNQTTNIQADTLNDNRALVIELEKLNVTKSGGGLLNAASAGFSNQAVTPVKIGDYYRFKITNNSDQTLYAAVFWIGSGGSIGLYTPTNTGEVVLPGKSLVTIPPLQAGAPTGLETYKVIATTVPGVDFHFLQQPSAAQKDVVAPLAWFLGQTTDQLSKDPMPASNLNLGDWITAQTDIHIHQ
jgi:GH24 family phage-related lysozyme (muramidase)